VEHTASSPVSLLLGTLLLRPYVFLFLMAYLVVAVRDLGPRRTLIFTAWVWPVAFLAEFSSTRTGFPFGLYHYTGSTRGQELFVSDVPFFDSLSFVFLAYAAWSLARVVAKRAGRVPTAVVAGALMMLLDVVIDPLAVRGDRWFLGRIFWYADPGHYFGVPLSNFAGWWLVGTAGVGGFLALTARAGGAIPGRPALGIGLYYGVLSFNFAMTAWIGEWSLLLAGLVIHAILAVLLFRASFSSAGFARVIEGAGVGRGTKSPSEG
jgi:uncharacterized membrane protein